MFIIFINDITNVNDIAKFVLFADDANLFISNIDRQKLYADTNFVLMKIYEYCSANKLIINFDKCCYIEFNCKSSSEKLHLGILNHSFERVERCKFLGIIINSSLNWNDHIIHAKTQIAKASGAIYNVRASVPRKIMRKLYFALVQPHLIYCLPIWGNNHASANFKDIFIAQKKIVRIITNNTKKVDGQFCHTKLLFLKTNILTVHNLYFYICSIEARKILTLLNKPPLLFDFFAVSQRSDRLILPKYSHATYSAKSFIFQTSKILNYFLAEDVSYIKFGIETFKSKIKRHLMTLQNISINEDPNWYPFNTNIFTDIQFS